MSLKTDIETYFDKSFTDLGIADADVKVWLKNGYRDLVGKLPVNILETIKTAIDIASTPYSLDGDRFLSALRNGRSCRQVSSQQKYGLTNIYSPLLASKIDPASYVEDGQVYIKPELDSGDAATIFVVTIPDIDITTNTIGNLQDTLKQFPIMYAAIRGKEYIIQTKLSDITTLYSQASSSFDDFMTYKPSDSFDIMNAFDGKTDIANLLSLGDTLSFNLTEPSFDLASQTIDFTDFDGHMGNEDVELATTELQGIQTELKEYSTKTQAELQGFQSEVQKFQAKVNKKLNTFQAEQNIDLKKAQAKMDAYIKNYTTQLQNAQSYLQEAQNRMNLAQSKMNQVKFYQNEVNTLYKKYDKELKEYLGIQRKG